MLLRECPVAPARAQMPPPARLPSLPAALARRAAIFGAVEADPVPAPARGPLAALAALLAPVAALRALVAREPAPADDLPALYAEARTLRAAVDRAESDAEVDRLADAIGAVERRAAALRVTTPAGAVAALEWLRAELLEDGTSGGFGPALIGHALGVLRTAGGDL